MSWRRGSSLVELIVALLLLELAGAAALAVALTAHRAGQHVSRGGTTDIARWERYRREESDSGCRNDAVPFVIAVPFPATTERDSFTASVRCGH